MMWAPGDRVVWPHAEGYGGARRVVRSAGVVVSVDEPGLPTGVRVRFDSLVHGVDNCYATEDELIAEDES